MTKAYRILAYLVAAEVVLQTAAIAFASYGLSKWIDNGGVADKSTFDSDDLAFTGFFGYLFHAVNGAMVIPILSVLFFVLAFFTKSLRGSVKWAAIVLALVALQVFLGFASHSYLGLGPLHGINAFALFLCALHAARLASTPATPRAATSSSPTSRTPA